MFRGKVRDRLDRDLPRALAISDPNLRAQEVRKILDRERRYAQQREEAIAIRSLGSLEAALVREKSPEGAYWKLSENVQQHTFDCLAMVARCGRGRCLSRSGRRCMSGASASASNPDFAVDMKP